MRFTLPRDLYHGKGALENLKTLKGKKAIIVVGGGSMKRNGFLQKAEAYLKEAGMEGAASDAAKMKKGDAAELAEDRLKDSCWVPAWLCAPQPKAIKENQTETDHSALAA